MNGMTDINFVYDILDPTCRAAPRCSCSIGLDDGQLHVGGILEEITVTPH